jgi:hypothetical protein
MEPNTGEAGYFELFSGFLACQAVEPIPLHNKVALFQVPHARLHLPFIQVTRSDFFLHVLFETSFLLVAE